MTQCAWDVVALAALTAMERARAGLRAVGRRAAAAGAGAAAADSGALDDEEDGPSQGFGAAAAAPGGAADAEAGGPSPPSPLDVAKARAVADFWQRLVGFAELGLPPKGWGDVGSANPILSVVDGELRCCPAVAL
jgi:hypothetical protein